MAAWRQFGPLLLAAALAGCGDAPSPAPPPATAAAVPVGPVPVPQEIAAFYRERGSRPLWMGRSGPRPAADALVAEIVRAADHGLDPARYELAALRAALDAARGGDARVRARAELLLSRAYARFVRDIRTPDAGLKITYVDEGLETQPPSVPELLAGAAAAPDLAAYVRESTRLNPLYDALVRGHARWRAANPRRSPAADALARRNLDRARAIPPYQGKYVIVDAASARLWMIEGRRIDGPMRVIAGKPDMQTPGMAGLIRHVVLNPYWNVPPDLARIRAKRVLKQGPGFLKAERIELLSDWGDRPRLIAPGQVDWRAVAAGRKTLRMRQRPGGDNVMGKVKFMLPNRLGIYLHDFPDKELFARDDRLLSSGCVRLEDAPRFARFLFGGREPEPKGSGPEQRVDLPEPVPVYFTYLTALPDPQRGLSLRRDVYARDRTEPPPRG
jgi:murein L,D-transpeptidase YcbB/YkuD